MTKLQKKKKKKKGIENGWSLKNILLGIVEIDQTDYDVGPSLNIQRSLFRQSEPQLFTILPSILHRSFQHNTRP